MSAGALAKSLSNSVGPNLAEPAWIRQGKPPLGTATFSVAKTARIRPNFCKAQIKTALVEVSG